MELPQHKRSERVLSEVRFCARFLWPPACVMTWADFLYDAYIVSMRATRRNQHSTISLSEEP
jgi:hypothetical protein